MVQSPDEAPKGVALGHADCRIVGYFKIDMRVIRYNIVVLAIMTAFKEFSARFAQSVCILTHDDLGTERSCTISSYSSVSASIEVNIFSFSLTRNSLMADIVRDNSTVRITLLSHRQLNVAKFYVKNRFDSKQFSIDRVVAESIGVVTGRIARSVPIGNSILFLAEVQDISLTPSDSRPLVYRLKQYE